MSAQAPEMMGKASAKMTEKIPPARKSAMRRAATRPRSKRKKQSKPGKSWLTKGWSALAPDAGVTIPASRLPMRMRTDLFAKHS